MKAAMRRSRDCHIGCACPHSSEKKENKTHSNCYWIFNPFLFSRSCSHVKEICLPNHAQAIRDHSSSITEQKVTVLENAMSRCFQVVLSYSCMEKSPLRGMFSPDEHKNGPLVTESFSAKNTDMSRT